MPAFKISDRVRVRATSATTGLAGRVGAVVLVNRKSDRKPSVFYVVRWMTHPTRRPTLSSAPMTWSPRPAARHS